jgi:hypothetical protein
MPSAATVQPLGAEHQHYGLQVHADAKCTVVLFGEVESPISYSRSSHGSPAATRSTASYFSSASGAPVTTSVCHDWTFDPDGAQAAAATALPAVLPISRTCQGPAVTQVSEPRVKLWPRILVL